MGTLANYEKQKYARTRIQTHTRNHTHIQENKKTTHACKDTRMHASVCSCAPPPHTHTHTQSILS